MINNHITAEWARQLAYMAYGDLPFETMRIIKVAKGIRIFRQPMSISPFRVVDIQLNIFYDAINQERVAIGYSDSGGINTLIISDAATYTDDGGWRW
jgi:hypothetical protein